MIVGNFYQIFGYVEMQKYVVFNQRQWPTSGAVSSVVPCRFMSPISSVIINTKKIIYLLRAASIVSQSSRFCRWWIFFLKYAFITSGFGMGYITSISTATFQPDGAWTSIAFSKDNVNWKSKIKIFSDLFQIEFRINQSMKDEFLSSQRFSFGILVYKNKYLNIL